MGQVNVSDILADPDLVDPIVIIHRKSTVDVHGENKLEECGVPTYGVVQPASGKTMQRLPDAMRVANVKSFWVKGKIISDGSSQYPDVISHGGTRYAVQVIFDWANWGEGWCEGTCVREKPTL